MQFGDIKGMTLTSIKGMKKDSDLIELTTDTGRTFQIYHMQDCCETVYVEDVIGDVKDLIGEPLVMAKEVSNMDLKPLDEHDLDYLWTFYQLATIKGYVTIRWYGTSNGYYSMSVDFEETTKEPPKPGSRICPICGKYY